MQNILEELWYGNLCPCDEYRESAEQAADLTEYISTHRKDLRAALSDAQNAIFEKYEECRAELDKMSQREIFSYAFRLGARITFEVMSLHID